jgi:hypothetical protein
VATGEGAAAVAVLNDGDRPEIVAPTEVSWGSDEGTEDGVVDAAGQTLQRTLYHIAEDRARYVVPHRRDRLLLTLWCVGTKALSIEA